MTTICCINADNYLGRGKEYVEILFDKVRRNISDKEAFKFICFTDDHQEYPEGIVKRPLLPHLKGWWHKLYLFKSGVFEEGERVVFFDLDTVIVGGLDDIIHYDGAFATLRDFYRPDGLGPAVMMWTPTKGTEYIWTHFNAQWNLGIREDYIGYLGGRGDQAILEDVRRLTTQYALDTKGTFYERQWRDNPLQKIDFLQDILPNQFKSYKADARYAIPKGTRVVCFHGLPRPHEVKDGWVPDIWKIGGGSIMELEVVGNVSDDTLIKNADYALSLPIELLAEQYSAINDKRLAIVGGGPSLEGSLATIHAMQKGGAVVWALNNSFRYLCEHGIEPDAHLMFDGREENIKFVPEKTSALLLYGAQCHPTVIDKARVASENMVIWCPAISKMGDLLRKHKKVGWIISAGSSIGLKAMWISRLMGFRKVHLFGYDSSYKEGENHAYKQSLNNGENVIDVTVNGHPFKCAAWMATQVEEFRESVPHLVASGMEFTVHGEGLLPYIATTMA